jgi:type IV secretion system protein TrbD
MALRRTPIHRCRIGPNLFLGADPRLVAFASLASVALIAAAQQWWTLALAAALWVGALCVFRRMTKYDPNLVEIYIRSLRYRAYYPARSTSHRIARFSIGKHPHC